MDISSIVLLVFIVMAVIIASVFFVAYRRGQTRKLMEVEEVRLREEAKARHQTEEATRLKAEEEAHLKAEDDARLKAEEDARLQAEGAARLKAEEYARLQAEEAARVKAKEEALHQAEEAARLKVEGEARRQAEEAARIKAEEAARIKAEAEARCLAEAEVARLKAEEEAHRQAEEAARLKAEKEARRQAEEAARLKSEEEARHLAEAEAARLKAEEEAKRLAKEAARLKAEEEARRLAEAEAARLKAEEDARRLAEAEAARLKVEEETRLQAEAEATRLKAEEEKKRLEELMAGLDAEYQALLQARKAARQKKSIGGKRVEPVKRGGRPRATEKESLSKPAGNFSHNIDVVCWEKGRQWHLGVEISDVTLDLNGEIEVRQNNTRLKKGSDQENWWNLNKPFGEIVILRPDGEFVDGLNLGEENQSCIIFKLVGESRRFGRRVKHSSSGTYLLITPDNWIPDNPSCFSEESLLIPSCRAWFFVSEDSSGRTLVFNDPDGNPVGLPVKSQQFVLTGNQLIDAGDFGGPLFGIEPPCIQKPGEQTWEDVDTIILGEEGPGRNRWRKEFKPRQNDTVQKLPAYLLKRKIGWYFLRFYDSELDLIESLDFRFASDISNVKLPRFQVPSEKDGYVPAIVEISHNRNCSICCSEDNSKDFQIDTLPEGSKITVSPNPDNDKSHWMVECQNGKIKLTILIERIWWGITENNTPPSEWMDKPVSLSRNDLSAVSTKMLWIRVPGRSWCDGVSVGFHKRLARYYPLVGMEGVLNIPLRDLNAVEERNQAGSWSLRIWVDISQQSYEMPVASLAVLMICKRCNSSIQASDISSHLSSHLNDIIQPLNYEEMRKYLPHLPKTIYKCAYCNYYAGDNESHITSAIERHIELSCTKVDRKSGPAQVSFSKITSVDEIRNNYDRNLPHIYKCKECGQTFRDVPDAVRIDHLIQNHQNSMVRYQ
jgi:membrane protein involved in colicin uptake